MFVGYGSLEGGGRRRCTDLGTVPGGTGCVAFPALSETGAAGFAAGSEVGYNLQPLPNAGLVLGAAADYQSTRLRGYGESERSIPSFTTTVNGSVVTYGGPVSAEYHLGQRLDGLGTVRAKLGYASDRLFVYGTGGLAYGDVRLDIDTSFRGDFRQSRGLASGLRLGYAAGGGVEYAISPHLSVKAEGLYFDLGERTLFSIGTLGGAAYGGTLATRGFLARAGLNYRFGEGLPGFGVLSDLRALADPSAYAPLPASDWAFETGLRYVYSEGRFRTRLGAPGNAAQTNSRLVYSDVGAHAVESFVRVDHVPTGLFAKAFLGSGLVTSGHQTDQDYMPSLPRSSLTSAKVSDGDIGYAVADAGYTLLSRDQVRLGAFAGYQYVAEFINAFGCTQRIGGPACATSLPMSVKSYTEDAQWHALRLGLVGDLRYDRLKLSLEAAYLPVSELSGFDRHWQRASINPQPQSGSGSGYFLQGLVSYDLTQKISLGVGARYWSLNTDSASTKFPLVPASPSRFSSSRFGAFAQASYAFTDTSFDLGSVLRP